MVDTSMTQRMSNGIYQNLNSYVPIFDLQWHR